MAIDGLWRLARDGGRSVEGVCSSAGFLYLFIGSIWLILSRRGATPFHYPPRTVLLAAVHFHFTGFALPIVAGATAHASRAREGGAARALLAFRFIVAGILVGPALLAAGNVRHSPTLKLVYALGEFSAHNWLSVPEMACFHGTINALGFALCGLLGWALARRGA